MNVMVWTKSVRLYCINLSGVRPHILITFGRNIQSRGQLLELFMFIVIHQVALILIISVIRAVLSGYTSALGRVLDKKYSSTSTNTCRVKYIVVIRRLCMLYIAS